ncbi:MAG: glutamate-1-semialdehyde 2,1-aminomutase [Planctomycetota bacterium]
MSANPSEAGPTHRYANSHTAHARARAVMPGGVSSPVRAYRAVQREPVTVVSGSGAWVTDVDGNRYVDFVGSYGPAILGHADGRIAAAVASALERGATFGMPTEAETELAETIAGALPGVDVVRFVNSGTEAAMSAIRLARAATGRNKVIKCTGCYHGHTDALLVAAGSGATTLGVPSSPGVPASVIEHTVLVPYNDLEAVREAMERFRGDVACMAVEPVAGNMGCVPPADGYLPGLRDLCDAFDVPLLFDEVMTGFRVAWGGAQNRFGVTPDLTCLGKVMGGGLPCAAYGGREDLMRRVAPDGPVYQAGTLSGNPLAMAAGRAQLDALSAGGGAAYNKLETIGAALEGGLRQHAETAGCPVTLTRVGSMLGLFFTDAFDRPVTNYEQATACRTDRFTAFFGAMLDRGVMLAPSAFEAWFVSLAHDDDAIRHTLDAAGHGFRAAAAV